MPLTVQRVLTLMFGSRNERLLKKYHQIVDQVNALESKIQPMTDEQLRARTEEIREGVRAGKLKSSEVLHEAFAIIRESMDRHIGIRSIFNPEEHFDPDQFDDEMLEAYDSVQRHMIATGESWLNVAIPPKIYEAVRKLYPESRPPFRARPFDVQLIGGLVLYEGKIAEMATGEGKTFVAPLACFMRVLEGLHCHVVTVNDYLVRRDSMWIKPAFDNLGITVGFIQSDMEPGGETRKSQYRCDITYGTNSEFGFDYLRDNMKERADLQVQGPLDFAIVDEVDSILIDEARTPLIISGAAHDDAPKYRAADVVARKVMELNRPWDENEKKIDAAKRAMERGARTGEMEVIIVDEYTGRKMEGRQWSDGLHQSVEAKERVPIKQETQTLATITLQNFFKLYKALAGMTGTAMTESEEFAKIYRLEVVNIPTNRPVIRVDNDDRVYRKEREKWEAIIEEIKEVCEKGRPVLVGTTSVEKSEMLSNRLTRKHGIEHEVLNAKQHEREA